VADSILPYGSTRWRWAPASSRAGMEDGFPASHGTFHFNFEFPVSVATAVSPVHLDHFESQRGLGRREHPAKLVSEKIRSHGSACVSVRDGSMFPWFRSGDLIFVRRCDFEGVSAGDVVLFEQDGELLLHRVIRRTSNEVAGGTKSPLVTKGDARNREDAPVSAKQFLGRAIRVHRGKRHIDLESIERRFLGRALARISGGLPVLYRPLRAVKALLLA
jgi:signal peptidase I